MRPGELVDDDDLPVLDEVVLVALEEHVRLQGLLDVVANFMPSQSPLS